MSKVALVTGASAGIGKSTAEMMLQQGIVVYAAARRTEKMKDLAAKGAIVLAMDVTDDESMQAGVNRIMEEHGRIDVLVNNAGYGSFGSLEDVELSEGKYQFEVNVFGLARLSQLVIPTMRSQRSGKIINVSSVGGKIYEPLGSWYHSTKFAVEGMSDCLRLELKPFGIDVVLIEPGAIETEFQEIAEKKLYETSGHTAYAEMTNFHLQMFKGAFADGQASSPDVIANTIIKAVNANRPKARYASGRLAGFILFLRKVLSDHWMDKMTVAIFKQVAAQAK